MSGTPASARPNRVWSLLRQWRSSLAMRSRLWPLQPQKTAALESLLPESLESTEMLYQPGSDNVIDLSLDLADSTEPPLASAADQLLTMKTSTHGSLKAIRRQAQGKPPHTIKVWSLADLQRYGPRIPPEHHSPEQLGWE